MKCRQINYTRTFEAIIGLIYREREMNKIPTIFMLIALIFSGPAYGRASPNNIAEILSAHNSYRESLYLPPLRWSDRLEAKAQSWADHLAEIGQLVHSGPGQNLAMASAGTMSLTELVDLWGREEAYFTDGDFPDISTTGNWVDVGHYSQIIWRATTEVGCGFAENDGLDVLVCDYDPPGNVMGRRAY